MNNLKKFIKVFVSCHLILLQVTIVFSKGQTRIVGGVPTNIDDIPPLVQIFKNGNFHCGGALLSEYDVLTAAHCVYKEHPVNFEVVAAASQRTDPKQVEPGTRSFVRKIKVPSDFSRSNYNKDLAMIRLRRPIKGIKPIELCDQEWKDGDTVEVYGWGNMKEDAVVLATQLQKVHVNVVNKEKCGNMYRSKLNLTDSMFCASATGRDACLGDSGGPALINGKICGVVSVGLGCAQEGSPGIYTDVFKMRQIIKSSLEN